MIDFSKIEQYRENNRIETKKALGGLPKTGFVKDIFTLQNQKQCSNDFVSFVFFG